LAASCGKQIGGGDVPEGAEASGSSLQYSLEGRQEKASPEQQKEEIRDAMEIMGNELLADARVARTLMDTLDADGDRAIEKAYDLKMQADVLALLEEERFGVARWAELSNKERSHSLSLFFSEVNSILGTSAVGLVFADESADVAGYYNASSHILTLNTKHLGETGLFRTAIHELRHAYQSDAVANPQKFAVSEETIRWWAKPFVDPTPENYDAYFTQPREWDARNFAMSDIEVFSVPPPYLGSWELE
jgi:hypothetical protein